LQAAADIGSGASGTRTADNFVTLPQSDGRASGSRQGLRFFRDDADARLQINVAGVNQGMRRRKWFMMARPQTMASGESRRFGELGLSFRGSPRNTVEQRSYQTIQFCIFNQVRGLLPAKRPSKQARKTQHRATAAGQTPGRVILAQQFTLYAKYCRLQRQETRIGGRQ
jgi:hypothetical protein